MSALMAVDRGELIGRFHVGKRGVELALPGGVAGKAMPGRSARAACSSSMSAARSVTASRAASFCRPTCRPPTWAKRRPAFLLPPTYFCTSSIFEAGTIDLRVAVKLEHQVLFGLVGLFQQLQAAVAADAVRQVDDVVALAQLEKAVDDAAQPAARGAVQVGAMKQLAAADQRHAIGHQAKAGLQSARSDSAARPAAASRGRWRRFPATVRSRLGLADDEHVLPAGVAGAHRRRRARRAPWRCRR